jgi:hypothetical protein
MPEQDVKAGELSAMRTGADIHEALLALGYILICWSFLAL